MKKIILISLSLIILAVGGLFAYVSQIDWNTQKEKLSAQMSEIIGKKIQFSGNLQVNFLPHPQLSADNVHILNSQNGDKLATIKQLETEVSLVSLLTGKPDIRSLLLKEVEVWFTFDKDGVCNWRQKSKQDSYAGDNAFNLQNFNIQRSTVHFNHKKYDIAFDLTGFNADVRVGGPDGPYRVDGNFLKNNDRYGLALSIDTIAQPEDVGVSVVIAHPRTDSNLHYEGAYNVSADNLNGDFSGESQKTAEFINSLLDKNIVRDEYNLPMMFSTTIKSDVDEEKLTNLVIKFDKLFEGAGDVLIVSSKNKKKQVNVKYQLVKLNLLPFEKLLKEYFADYQKGGKYEPNLGFDVTYDLSSERVTISDEPTGVWESVSAKGTWKDDIFTLDDFYAACPGNIVTNLKVSLAEKESKPQYYIEAKINGQNALSYINSLGLKVKSPRQASYRDVDLTFDLSGNPQFLNVENIDLKMDKAEITGNMAVDLLKNEYVFNADADILNLDNYIMPGDKTEDMTVEDNFVAEMKRFAWFGDNKSVVAVTAGSATLNGVTARDVDISFASDGSGTLVVENATFKSMMSSDIDFSAIVKNWGKNNPVFDEVTFNIKSSGIKMLAEKWGIKLPKWPLFERGNIEESGVLLGNFGKIYINSLTKSGDSSFRYDGVLKNENNHLNFAGDVLLKTEHLENLMKLFWGEVTGKFYRGPLVAKSEVSGNSKNWVADRADIQMGSDKYTANVKIDEDKKVYKVSGSIYTTYLNLLNWINIQKTKTLPKSSSGSDDTFIAKPNFSGDVINYNGYRKLALDLDLTAEKSSYGDYSMNELQTHLSNGQGVLRFQNLKYENKHHKVKGNLQIDYSQTPLMSGNLTINYPEIKNLGGDVYAISANDVVIDTEFETPAVTIADMMDGLKGKIAVSGNALTVKGIDLTAVKDDLQSREYSKGLYQVVRENTQKGVTSFEGFAVEAMMNSGVFNFTPFVIKNVDTSVNVSGNINLKEWKMNNTLRIKYTDLKEIPDYMVIFSGMINKPNVDINVEEIANKYDKHWKEIEQERLRQQEILRQQRAEKAKGVSSFIEEVQDKATEIQRELEDNLSKHLTEDIVDRYKTRIAEVQDANKHLEEIKAKLNSDLSDEEITQNNNEAIKYNQQLDNIKGEISVFFMQDVENMRTKLSTRENDIYTKIGEVYEKFQNMWNESRDKLSLYNSLSFIDTSEEFNGYYSKIQESKTSADNIHSDIESRYAQFSLPDNWEEKHALAQSIENLTVQQDGLYSQMQDTYMQTANRLPVLIEERRVVFEKEQREEAIALKKQAEIDAQNLLISDNPNPVTESTYTESEVKTEVAATPQSIPENTASAPKITSAPSGVSGKIVTQYDKNNTDEKRRVRPTGTLLTPIDDSVQKPSESTSVQGIIKVK